MGPRFLISAPTVIGLGEAGPGVAVQAEPSASWDAGPAAAMRPLQGSSGCSTFWLIFAMAECRHGVVKSLNFLKKSLFYENASHF